MAVSERRDEIAAVNHLLELENNALETMPLWRPTKWRHSDSAQSHDASEIDRLRVAMQKALLGQITPEMRLISFETEANLVRIIVFFDTHLDDSDRVEFEEEITSCLGACLGDPPTGPSVMSHFIRCDEPQMIPVRGKVVFSRKGVQSF